MTKVPFPDVDELTDRSLGDGSGKICLRFECCSRKGALKMEVRRGAPI